MGNTTSVISVLEKRIVNPPSNKSECGCNCRPKQDFPLQDKCLTH